MNSANKAFAIAGVVLLTSGTCVSAGDVATVRVQVVDHCEVGASVSSRRVAIWPDWDSVPDPDQVGDEGKLTNEKGIALFHLVPSGRRVVCLEDESLMRSCLEVGVSAGITNQVRIGLFVPYVECTWAPEQPSSLSGSTHYVFEEEWLQLARP
jgi:hypothetical protein